MQNLFDALVDVLSLRWKAHHKPRTKRAYRCTCDKAVFFLNSECMSCNAPLGYEPLIGEIRALQPSAMADTWRPVGKDIEQDYQRCANFDSPALCNWLVGFRTRTLPAIPFSMLPM